MSGRQSAAVAEALRLIKQGHNASEAARAAGCDVGSVYRARKANKEPPLPRGRPKKATTT